MVVKILLVVIVILIFAFFTIFKELIVFVFIFHPFLVRQKLIGVAVYLSRLAVLAHVLLRLHGLRNLAE